MVVTLIVCPPAAAWAGVAVAGAAVAGAAVPVAAAPCVVAVAAAGATAFLAKSASPAAATWPVSWVLSTALGAAFSA